MKEPLKEPRVSYGLGWSWVCSYGTFCLLLGSPKPLIILPVQSEGVPTSGAFPLARPHPSSPAALPSGEELKQVLITQLEYYFSKDNLSSDKYLCKF